MMVYAFFMACLLFSGCGEGGGSSSSGGGSTEWLFILVNETEGLLTNITIDGNVYDPLGLGESHTVIYISKPGYDIPYYAEGFAAMGTPMSWDDVHTPTDPLVDFKHLVLDPAYFSIWVTNNSTENIDTFYFDFGLASQAGWTFPDQLPAEEKWYGFFDKHTNNTLRWEANSGATIWQSDPPIPYSQNADGSFYYSGSLN